MKLSRVKDYKAARTPEDKEFLKHEVASDTADHLETIAKALSKVQVAATGEDGKDGEQGEKGDPGERGERGEDGKQGVQGPSGKDSKDGRDGFDGRDGRDGLDGRDGENGKEGSPDSAEDVRNKLELLDGEERLDAKFIKNLGHFVKNVYNQVEHIGGSILDVFANGSRVGGAGALDIIAGSNVTISSSFDGNKAKLTINASGGGASLNVADLSAQCTGSNLVFTIPVFTKILQLTGTDSPNVYRPSVDFTATGTTLTLSGVNAPSSGATLILLYA